MTKSKWLALLSVILILLIGARCLRWESVEEVTKTGDGYSLKVLYLTDRWSGQTWTRVFGITMDDKLTIMGGQMYPVIGKQAITSPNTEQEKAAYNNAFLIKQALSISWMITTFFISAGVLSLALSLNKDGLKV